MSDWMSPDDAAPESPDPVPPESPDPTQDTEQESTAEGAVTSESGTSESPLSWSERSREEEGPFLFQDLAIIPPLEEFNRLFQKKIRSFESGEFAAEVEPYQQAFRLGQEMILRHQGEEEGC